MSKHSKDNSRSSQGNSKSKKAVNFFAGFTKGSWNSKKPLGERKKEHNRTTTAQWDKGYSL